MSIKTTVGSSLRILANLGVDLTGATVAFVFTPVAPAAADNGGVTVDLTGGGEQTRVATVVDAPGGQASYTLTPTDTAVPGWYRAQFQFTAGGLEQVFPATGWLELQVEDFVAPASFAALTDFCDPVRAIMGDFQPPYKFADDAVASVVRTLVRMNTVPGYGITSDGLSVTPAVIVPCDLAKLVYNSARTLLRPNLGAFQWRTRAMSIRREGQKEFLRELENLIYYMDNPTQLASFQSYYAWVNSIAGINVWSMMTEMKVQSPVATVTIGTGGLQVNTT
jgi:hypothetical protein